MAKELKMTFTLDNEKSKLLNLPSPRADLSADDVRSFMNTVVAKDAFDVNGARVAAAKSAVVRSVDEEVLF